MSPSLPIARPCKTLTSHLTVERAIEIAYMQGSMQGFMQGLIESLCRFLATIYKREVACFICCKPILKSSYIAQSRCFVGLIP